MQQRTLRVPRGRRLTPALFLLPSLAGFLLFYIAPFLISLGYSFLDKPVGGRFVGLRNFAQLLTNPAYRQGLANTLRFIALCVPLNTALSLLVAAQIHKLPRRRELFSLLFLVPLVIPSGSMVTFWKAVFAADGALNRLLHTLGLHAVNWLDSDLAMLVMVAIFIWKNMGYNMVLFLSGLGGIPRESYEAAGVDGAGPLQCLLSITLPGLLPTFVLVSVMSVINSFKVFKEIYLITGSHPHESIYTLQHFMNNMFSSLNYQRLTTATTLLVLLIAVFTQGILRLERRLAQ